MIPNKLVDELEEIIYVSDPQTYELLYANEYAKSVMGITEYTGQKCYKLIQGFDAPCPFCTNPLLKRGGFYVWEHTNPVINRHFILKDKLIDWDGRLARLEIAVDITQQENLSQNVRQKLKTEKTIVNCIRGLTEAETLDDAMQAVLSGVGVYYQADRAYILELDEKTGCASNTYEWCAEGIGTQISLHQGVKISDIPFWQEAAQNRELVFVSDIEELRAAYPTEYFRMKSLCISRLIAAPFTIQEKSCGYIGVDNPSYNAEDPSLLQSLSYFVINELQKRRMQKELEYQNSHDALTGLYNRFQYLKFLDASFNNILNSIGVVFCDINGLKQINDLGGHSAGDQAIIRTAEILQGCFPLEQVYRLSGDEFIVLCENVDQPSFQQMVNYAKEEFRKQLDRGVSLGCIWQKHCADLHSLVRRADEFMYQEKQKYYQDHPR